MKIYNTTENKKLSIQGGSKVTSFPSGDLDLSKLNSLFYNSIGSRAGCLHALIVNLGDGTSGLIYQDDNDGDFCMATLDGSVGAEIYETEEELVDAVLSTWGKSSKENSDESTNQTNDSSENTSNSSVKPVEVETISGDIFYGTVVDNYEAKEVGGYETVLTLIKLDNGKVIWTDYDGNRGIHYQVDKNRYKIFDRIK